MRPVIYAKKQLQIPQTQMPGSKCKSTNMSNQDNRPSPEVINPIAIGPEKRNVVEAQDREWVVFLFCD